MSAQVMRTQLTTNQPSGFGDNNPGTFIGNGENPIILTLADFQGIFAKPVGHLLRNEYEFVLPAAFRFLQNQFSILKVLQPEL